MVLRNLPFKPELKTRARGRRFIQAGDVQSHVSHDTPDNAPHRRPDPARRLRRYAPSTSGYSRWSLLDVRGRL
jgi:hypothetical protein